MTKEELEILEKVFKEITDAINDLRTRVKVLEEKKPETVVHQHYYNNPISVPSPSPCYPWTTPIVTCGGTNG